MVYMYPILILRVMLIYNYIIKKAATDEHS